MKTRSYFYSDRQNKLIEKAALSNNYTKRAKSLAKQFNRPEGSILGKMIKIRKIKNISKKRQTVITTKDKFMKVAQGTVLSFNNIKKAEMHADHIRIFF